MAENFSRDTLMCNNCGLCFEVPKDAVFVVCPGCGVTITVSAERMPVENVAFDSLLITFFLN